MNDKLSLQDLADILYKQTKISKKEAELFFKEFFQLILERIYQNDSVKIKDFGTFKLTAISSRESVDVNTGEKIEIPAHYRFTFAPDKTLKELINKPYATYQTVLLEEGMNPSEVNFEALALSDTDDDDDEYGFMDENEVSKIIQEQAKIINELKSNKMAASENKEDNQDNINGKSEQKPIDESADTKNGTKPFVYSYTSSDKDKKRDDAIVYSVAKNKLSKALDDEMISLNREVTPEADNDTVELDEAIADFASVTNDATVVDNDDEPNQEVQEVDAQELVEPIIDIPLQENDLEVVETIQLQSEDVLPAEEDVLLVPELPLEEDEDQIELDTVFFFPNQDNAVETDSVDLPLEIQEDETDEEVTVVSAVFEPSDDVVEPIVADEQVQSKADSMTEKTDESTNENRNPDRPLIPVDETPASIKNTEAPDLAPFSGDNNQIDIDTAFVGAENADDKPTQEVSDNHADNLSQEDLSPYYQKYENKPSTKSKVLKMLPFIVLAVVLLGFGVYKVLQLFDVKYDYERYLGINRSNLTMTDSMVFLLDKEDTSSFNQLAVDDSLKMQSEVIVPADTAPAMSATSTPAQELDNTPNSTIEEVGESILIEEVVAADSVAPSIETSSENTGRRISKNLTIKVVDKAQYFLHHVLQNDSARKTNELIHNQILRKMTDDTDNASSAGQAATTSSSNSQSVKYNTVVQLQQGMTLRSLATKYYGNSAYWVYIYMANRDQLPNPNSITIGQRLTIPALSEYGVTNPKDKSQIQKAIMMEGQIPR